MINNIVHSLFRLAFCSQLAVFLILLAPTKGNLADENSAFNYFFGVINLKPNHAVCINFSNFGADTLSVRLLYIDLYDSPLAPKQKILVPGQALTPDYGPRVRKAACDQNISQAGMVTMQPDSIYIAISSKPPSTFEVKVQVDRAKAAAERAEAAVIQSSVAEHDDRVPILLAAAEGNKAKAAKTPDKLVAEAKFWAEKAKIEADRAEAAASKADRAAQNAEMAAAYAIVNREKSENGMNRAEASGDRAEAAEAKANASLKKIEEMLKEISKRK